MSEVPARTFTPRTESLPAPQRRLWRQLAPTYQLGFVLYGGTAIALRLEHRTSVDFDFFSDRALDHGALRIALPFMAIAATIQDAPETWSLLVPDGGPDGATVKLSFFGGMGFGRVGAPDTTADSVLQVASREDLLATKLKVLLQRVEAKDYRDIAALLAAGSDLATGLAAAVALYGNAFQPSECRKALVYFEGGDLQSLSDDEKARLVKSVSVVRDLPRIPTSGAVSR